MQSLQRQEKKLKKEILDKLNQKTASSETVFFDVHFTPAEVNLLAQLSLSDESQLCCQRCPFG